MSEKLKPCPFCDGDAKLFLRSCNGIPSGDIGTEAIIQCNKCNVKSTRWALKKNWAKKSVIEAWNRRVDERIEPSNNEIIADIGELNEDDE